MLAVTYSCQSCALLTLNSLLQIQVFNSQLQFLWSNIDLCRRHSALSTVSELGFPSALSSKILLGLLLVYTIMDYGKLCQEILNLDPKIRFAGVCDNTGETKFGDQGEGVKNRLSPEETKKSN